MHVYIQSFSSTPRSVVARHLASDWTAVQRLGSLLDLAHIQQASMLRIPVARACMTLPLRPRQHDCTHKHMLVRSYQQASGF